MYKDATKQRHKKPKEHKRYKDASKQKHKKHKEHKNANKLMSDFFPIICFYAHKTLAFLFLFAYVRFVLFVRVKYFRKKV